jgi:hypothetical protein
MSTIGQVERKTQLRVVKLFRDTLGYAYLGDWTDRVGNRNIDENLLRTFLREQGYDEAFITRALHLLDKALYSNRLCNVVESSSHVTLADEGRQFTVSFGDEA